MAVSKPVTRSVRSPRSGSTLKEVLTQQSEELFAQLTKPPAVPSKSKPPMWSAVIVPSDITLTIEEVEVVKNVTARYSDDAPTMLSRSSVTLRNGRNRTREIVLPRGLQLWVCREGSTIKAFATDFLYKGVTGQLTFKTDGAVAHTPYSRSI